MRTQWILIWALLCGCGNMAAGQLVIIYPFPTPPVYQSGTNLIWHASFGANGAYMPFYVVASTNLTSFSTNWSRVLTNAADSSGGFSVTLPIEPDKPSRFYRIAIPVL